MFPVPFTNELNIRLDRVFENIHVEVLELSSGKLVETLDFNAVETITLNNDYAKGMYLIRVYGDESILTTQRVVKI